MRRMAPFAAVVPEIAELVGDIAFDPGSLRRRYREERDKRLRPDGNDQYVEVKVVVPRIADERSKEILRELARLNPDNPRTDLW